MAALKASGSKTRGARASSSGQQPASASRSAAAAAREQGATATSKPGDGTREDTTVAPLTADALRALGGDFKRGKVSSQQQVLRWLQSLSDSAGEEEEERVDGAETTSAAGRDDIGAQTAAEGKRDEPTGPHVHFSQHDKGDEGAAERHVEEEMGKDAVPRRGVAFTTGANSSASEVEEKQEEDQQQQQQEAQEEEEAPIASDVRRRVRITRPGGDRSLLSTIEEVTEPEQSTNASLQRPAKDRRRTQEHDNGRGRGDDGIGDAMAPGREAAALLLQNTTSTARGGSKSHTADSLKQFLEYERQLAAQGSQGQEEEEEEDADLVEVGAGGGEEEEGQKHDEGEEVEGLNTSGGLKALLHKPLPRRQEHPGAYASPFSSSSSSSF